MQRIYSKEVDQPSLKSNQQLVRSVPVDNKQSLKTHLRPLGFTGYKVRWNELMNKKKDITTTSTTTSATSTNNTPNLTTEQELVCLGHPLRSLAYLNRGNDAETIFSRVAIVDEAMFPHDYWSLTIVD